MTRGGRPRRKDEQPDSLFGKALKEHLRPGENFNQKDLASKAMISERALSEMVKGKRTSGTMLRRDLRAIIEVLYQRGTLLSLEEANRLITKIPAIKELDERDPDDAKIIALFDAPEADEEQAADQHCDEAPDPNVQVFTENQDGALASAGGVPKATPAPPAVLPSPGPETTECAVREPKKHLWWYIISALAVLAIVSGAILGR